MSATDLAPLYGKIPHLNINRKSRILEVRRLFRKCWHFFGKGLKISAKICPPRFWSSGSASGASNREMRHCLIEVSHISCTNSSLHLKLHKKTMLDEPLAWRQRYCRRFSRCVSSLSFPSLTDRREPTGASSPVPVSSCRISSLELNFRDRRNENLATLLKIDHIWEIREEVYEVRRVK